MANFDATISGRCYSKSDGTFDNGIASHSYVGDNLDYDYDYYSCWRWTNVTIPIRSSITTAYVTVEGYTGNGSYPFNTKIYGEAADSPALPTSKADMDGRARTSAYAEWNPGTWNNAQNYNTASLVSVIQELVNRSGWASGNSLNLFWQDASHLDGFTSQHLFYTRDDALRADIHIVYSLVASVVTTQAVTAISGTTATGNGNITTLGSGALQHGHCWNTAGTPTTVNSKTTNGVPAATGVFTSAITGLTAGTLYYVRAYVTDSQGTSYGNEVIFWANKGTVYPSEPLCRSTNLIHRYDARQSINQLEISLGDITSVLSPPFMASAARATASSQKSQDTTPIIETAVAEAVKDSTDFMKRSARQIPLYSANVTALQSTPKPIPIKDLGLTPEEAARIANQPGIIELLRQLGKR